jgi:tellurite resistance protein TehA-like permease
MPPAYFALVMATGILAIACQLVEIPTLPRVLAGINLVAYAILWLLTLVVLGCMSKIDFGAGTPRSSRSR